MFRPSPSLKNRVRRLPLSTKQAGKEYYKGNRVGSMGTIDRHGNFSPDWSKIRTFVYPTNVRKSNLTPFVASNVEKTRFVEAGNYYENYPERFTGKDYLRNWKIAGGYDIVPEQPKQEPIKMGTTARRKENMPVVSDVRPKEGRSMWR